MLGYPDPVPAGAWHLGLTPAGKKYIKYLKDTDVLDEIPSLRDGVQVRDVRAR